MEGNLFDYLEWRGDLTFGQSPLGPVDALIFSALSYLNYPVEEGEELRFSEAHQRLSDRCAEEQFRGLEMMRTQTLRLSEQAAASARFRRAVLTRYAESFCEETEKQFAAMTFLLPDKMLYVAFRGTDGTLVGWKEDFNMAFTEGTPAQLEAARYTEEIAAAYPDRTLVLGGHSKGGNLAVWAAVHLPEELRPRLRFVYNFDGPGFSGDLTRTPAYQAVCGRILSYVPESSLVGVLLGYCDYLIIRSKGVSLLQHDPFSWCIVGKRFAYAEERSAAGKLAEKAANDLIRSLSPEEKEKLVNRLYEEFRSGDEKTVNDLKKTFLSHAARLTADLCLEKLRASDLNRYRRQLTEAVRRQLKERSSPEDKS